MLRAFGHPVERYCKMLRYVGVVGSNLKMAKFFMQHLWMLHDVVVVWQGWQQCCTRTCALVRFTIPNMSQHVATGWPNARNMLRPTILRCVVLKSCCDRLAGACKCWASHVEICCVDVLPGLNARPQSLYCSLNKGHSFKPR